ncbi:MAG TPA: DsbA family protein [Chloroflexota bacterium]|nr:DsbA family protein [Chloroflexota bacterium]
MTELMRETVRRQRLAFYFDPICPFAWRAAEWVREVSRSRPLDVEWRLFSLGVHNDRKNATLMMPMRVLALVERRGGANAVARLYQTLGRRIHEGGVNVRAPGALEHAIEEALRDAGLEPELLNEALAADETAEWVREATRQAEREYGAYGVPWLVLDDCGFGFNGPVLGDVPGVETGRELWDHISWLLAQSDFYEIKRERHPAASRPRRHDVEQIAR